MSDLADAAARIRRLIEDTTDQIHTLAMTDADDIRLAQVQARLGGLGAALTAVLNAGLPEDRS